MQVSIHVSTVSSDRFFSQFPEEMRESVELFRDRVGYKLDAESKRAAPAITGNLRRNIIYRQGELVSHAEYSKYVHGAPFYQNRTRRRETPFITNAVSNSESFIRNEAREVVRRAVN